MSLPTVGFELRKMQADPIRFAGEQLISTAILLLVGVGTIWTISELARRLRK